MTGSALAETRTLNGTVAYRERIALPPSTVLEVALVDVSRADAPAITLAQTRVEPAGQVPIAFALDYEDTDIEPSRTYALEAKILVDGQPWFATTRQYRVFDDGEATAEIIVTRVVANDIPGGAEQLAGDWIVVDIEGRGVIEDPQARLKIADGGAVSGTGGCNRMAGQATISGDRIDFGPMVATQMACLPAVMEQERSLFDALEKVRGWRIDETGDRLLLLDENAETMVTLRRG
ncbi:YbaY family lipoprotein [Mesorhizobium xinjiangense]|uniref:YbaY family lipoprotein n=1 Tax=Mesorhizobium xinjiangense TaxID=2678685 RepID=UPI0018DD8631|nr:YbaY family lipoprotein [Mesorhizobium xinjiangense]